MRQWPQYGKIVIILCSCLLMAKVSFGQDLPCRDTLVNLTDSICEGQSYNFGGREITYPGMFFDTLKRVGTQCDSIVILKLNVLIVHDVSFVARRHCHDDVGYELVAGFTGINYYKWSASPNDSTLIGHEHQTHVVVHPQQPTTYTLYVDYREEPLCPSTGSRQLNPIEPVMVALYSYPDVLTYDNMQLTLHDYSVGNREAPWGGWSGRNWYINGTRLKENGHWLTVDADPSWGDTVEVLMEAFTPTCVDTITRLIPFKRVSILFPNIFSPNGNENNRFFGTTTQGVLEYEIWIYDRQGMLVFHSSDRHEEWDGTCGNINCPQGVYAYCCRYRDVLAPAGFKTVSGTVTLLR